MEPRKQTGLLEHLFFSQTWMGLSGVAYLYLCTRLLGRAVPVPVYGAAFFWTRAIYLWDAGRKFSAEDELNQPLRSRYLRQMGKLASFLPTLFLLIAGALILPFLCNVESFSLILILLMIGIAYVFPAIPWNGERRRIKEMSVAKTFVVTFAWAIGGVGVPIAFGNPAGPGLAAPSVMIAGYITLLLFLDAASADYRDQRGDRRRGIRTVATELGSRTWHVLLAASLATGAVWVSGLIADGSPRWIVAGIMWACSLSFLLFIDRLAKHEVSFGIALSAWRFAGALALFIM